MARVRKNEHAVGTYQQISAVPWKIKVATFTVLLTAWAHNRNSLIHCIWFNGAQTNPVVAYIANIIECKYSQLDRCLLLSDVFLAVVVIIAKASYCDC